MRILSSLFSLWCLVSVVSAQVSPVPAPGSHNLKWGPMGHYIVALVAENFLNSNATTGCQNLLPDVGGDISLIASWADNMRDIWPWSAPLHYINTPDWQCNYIRSRDCQPVNGVPNFCVDGAIQNYTQQIMNQNLSNDQNVDALKFVVHFIGDIHQPLHVGFTGDEGGNTIKGTFEGTPDRKLHQIWDTDIIMQRINNDFNGDNSSWASYLTNRLTSGDLSSKVAGWQACNDGSPYAACTQGWALESVKAACSNAYVDVNGNHIQDGFDLEDPYYDKNYPVVEIQIAKAAVRLASVLNNVFDEQAALGWPLLKKFGKHIVDDSPVEIM